MNTLPTYCVVEYLPLRKTAPIHQNQWAVHHYLKLVKEGSANNDARLSFLEKGLMLASKQPNKSKNVSARLMWAQIQKNVDLSQTVALVPVPSSSTIASSGPTFLTADIANRVAAYSNGALIVQPWLRFKSARAKSRDSKSRNVAEIKAAYTWAREDGRIPKRVVLLDDVITTGAHVKAAASFLSEKGAEVRYAVSIFRTVTQLAPGGPKAHVFLDLDYY